MKHKLLIAFTLTLSLCLTGCPESTLGEPGKTLFEEAKMEELSENDEQARKMYKEILDKYPETKYGRLAKARLAGMDKQE